MKHRPRLLFNHREGKPSLEMQVEKERRHFGIVARTALVIAAATYFSHGGVGNGYCGWQGNTTLRQNATKAWEQVDEQVIEPSVEGLKKVISFIDEKYKRFFTWDNIKNSHKEHAQEYDPVSAEKETPFIDSMYKHALEARDNYVKNEITKADQTSSKYIGEMHEKAVEIKQDGIERALAQAKENTAVIEQLRSYAQTLGEERVKQYAGTIGQDQFMKLVEKAATGDKTVLEQFKQFTNKE